MPPISLSRSALAGLIYALLMCVWKYLADDLGFDELAIRFAVYFTAFTLGFWLIMRLLARRKPPRG